jgi:hypothetical protein
LLWLWQVKGAAHTFSCVTPRIFDACNFGIHSLF